MLQFYIPEVIEVIQVTEPSDDLAVKEFEKLETKIKEKE
jgi:hypothetical protein